MSATSVGVAPSGECLRSKDRYGSCGWQLKLCDPLAIGPYLSALEMRFLTKWPRVGSGAVRIAPTPFPDLR